MSFGDVRPRALLVILPLVLIASTVWAIVAWRTTGGRISGSILLPAAAGAILLFRRRGGSLEYLPERRELRIELRSILGRRSVRLPVGDIDGLTVSPSHFKDAHSGYDLLLLCGGASRLRLLSGRDAAALEPARNAVSSFLLEQGLLRGRDP